MVDAKVISDYPAAWAKRTDEFVGKLEVSVCGLDERVQVTAVQLRGVYFPLLGMLGRMAESPGRIVAGLAGIPGSGKSTLTAVVQRLADALIGPGWLVVVGMDGWHWPNHVLAERTTQDAQGRPIPLSQRKGGSDSFDTAGLARALIQVKTVDGDISLPIYDRRVHQPVPDGVIVPAEARVVLLEGNYLLSDLPGWSEVGRQLSPRFYLHCDENLAGTRVIERHRRGGSDAATAQQRYEQNDRENIRLVAQSADWADYLIHWEPSPAIYLGVERGD